MPFDHMSELFGLPQRCIQDIRSVLKAFPSVERALIFGSRAIGNSRPGSDIDLALFGENISFDDLMTINARLEQLPFAYTYDVIVYDQIKNPAVKAHIDDFGLNFYEKPQIEFGRVKTNQWNKFRLGDHCLKIGSGATPRGGQENYKNQGIALIRSQNVIDFAFSKTGLAFIDVEQATALSNVEVQEGDVLLNITGDSVARVCQAPQDVLPARVNQHVAIIRPDSDAFDSAFLKYYLLNPAFKDFMLGLSSSGATRNALTKGMIEDFEIFAPPLPTQRRIAAILTALDDKIELNRRMNETLEGMAQAVWEEWFGKYASGEEGLPEGWQEYNLGKLVESVSKTYKFNKDKIIFLNTSDIMDGQVLTNEYSDVATLPGQAKKSIQRNDILYSEIRPANKRYAFVNFDASEFVVSTKLMVLRSTGIFDPLLIYFYLTREEILDHLQMLAESRSGTFPQITFDHIRTLKFRFPDEKTVEEFTDVIKPLYQQKFENEIQSRTLAALRDALMPRLMRGEVTV